MPEEPLPPPPETPPPGAGRRVGTGFAGETTRPASEAGASAEPGPSTRPGGALPISEIIGDFEVLGRLGAGGMGAVYRARQISLGRMVALKVLPAQFIEDPDAVNRFQREARVAARLSHPNLVRVFSAGVAEHCHYIAMELIEGEDLGVRLRRDGKLNASAALRIIADVARGLQYGWHSAQLVHRDIKPGNIFLSHEGTVKLGDLGLAKLLDSSTTGLTQTGTMMGTPHYISPEQARGDREIDFHADIYSLGCTLFHVLTGQTPYHGTEAISLIRQHLDAPVPAILKVWPQCPIPLGRLVSKMLKKSRHERHASYEELITQIESVWAQIDPAGYAPEAFAPTKPPDSNAAQVAGAPLQPQVGTARRALPDHGTLGERSLPGKSKAALYGGIAAVVVGIAAFLIWPKTEKLTKAQIYARDHANEPSASAETAGGMRSGASQTSGDQGRAGARPSDAVGRAPGANALWRDWVAEKRLAGRFVDNPDFSDDGTQLAALNVHEFSWDDVHFRNGSVRITWTTPSGKTIPNFFFRRITEESGSKNYFVVIGPKNARLQWREGVDGAFQFHLVGQCPLPPDFDLTREHTVEARALDDHLTVLLDGQEIINAQDSTLAQAGGIGFFTRPGTMVRKFECQSLDGAAGAADGPATAPAALRSPAWQPLFSDAEWRAKGANHEFKDGLVRVWGAFIKALPLRDGAVRVRVQVRKGDGPVILLARDLGEAGHYKFALGHDFKSVALDFYDRVSKKWAQLEGAVLPVPVKPGDTFTMELRIQGDHLTGLFNGAVMLEARDARLAGPGRWGVDPQGGEVWVESVEFQSLDASAAAGTPSAEPWQDVLHDPGKLYLTGAVERTAEGLRFTDTGRVSSTKEDRRDGAVRMRTIFGGTHFMLRLRSGAVGMYELCVVKGGDHINLRSYKSASKQWTSLHDFPLPAPLQQGQEYELEFRAVGPSLTAKVNGEILGTFIDETFAAGRFAVSVDAFEGTPALLKSFEFLDLDASNAADTPPVEPWEDVLHDPGKLHFAGTVKRTAEGLYFTGHSSAYFAPGEGPQHDGAIRMRAVVGGVRPGLKVRGGNDHSYRLYLGSDHEIKLAKVDGGHFETLQVFPLLEPLPNDQEYTLELRVVGSTLTAKCNGELLGTVTDERLPAGEVGVSVADNGTNPSLVKSLEVLDLDAPGGAATAAASVAENWQRRLERPEDHDLDQPTMWQDGWITYRPGSKYQSRKTGNRFNNGAVRAEFKWASQDGDASLWLRGTGRARYALSRDSLGVHLLYYNGENEKALLKEVSVPEPRQGDIYTLEFRAIGRRLIGKLDGKEVVAVEDDHLSGGDAFIYLFPNGPLRNLEVLDLDSAVAPPPE